MGTNWNHQPTDQVPSVQLSTAGKLRSKKRYCLSRLRRNARHLQAFLEWKRLTLQENSCPPQTQKVPEAQVVRSVSKSTVAVNTGSDVISEVSGNKGNLKACVNSQSVTCIEFCVDEDEPGLSLELDCSKTVWTPVNVKRPGVSAMGLPDGRESLSVHELAGLDDVELRSHEVDDSPGVILRKGCLEVWTPIAARTRSKHKGHEH